MSDNKNKKTDAQQANSQPSYAEQAHKSWKSAFQKSAAYTGENVSTAGINSKSDAAIFASQAVAAGGKDYGQALSNSGKSIMQGARQQFPNDGQQLNNMKINQAIKEGRAKADQQKSISTDKSSNKGIASFQDKANSKSSSNSKSNSSSASKGSSSGSGKSSGSSSGGGKSGGSSNSGSSSGGQSR